MIGGGPVAPRLLIWWRTSVVSPWIAATAAWRRAGMPRTRAASTATPSRVSPISSQGTAGRPRSGCAGAASRRAVVSLSAWPSQGLIPEADSGDGGGGERPRRRPGEAGAFSEPQPLAGSKPTLAEQQSSGGRRRRRQASAPRGRRCRGSRRGGPAAALARLRFAPQFVDERVEEAERRGRVLRVVAVGEEDAAGVERRRGAGAADRPPAAFRLFGRGAFRRGAVDRVAGDDVGEPRDVGDDPAVAVVPDEALLPPGPRGGRMLSPPPPPPKAIGESFQTSCASSRSAVRPRLVPPTAVTYGELGGAGASSGSAVLPFDFDRRSRSSPGRRRRRAPRSRRHRPSRTFCRGLAVGDLADSRARSRRARSRSRPGGGRGEPSAGAGGERIPAPGRRPRRRRVPASARRR